MEHIEIHRFTGISNLGSLREAMKEVELWGSSAHVRFNNDQLEIWWESET